MTPKAERATGLRADAARNRARLLKIARELLAAGDDSLQLNTIARLAGVGVGTVYRHFPNRNALLEALSAERLRQLAGEIEAASADGDARAGLRRALRSALDYALADAGVATALESDGGDAQTSALKARLALALAELLGRAREAGAVRAEIDVADVRHLLCGVVHAVRVGDGAPRRAEVYLDILAEGLRPHS